jgi:uncharacterized protein (DUF58 family)
LRLTLETAAMTKPAPLNWYCPTCAALRPARRRWTAWSALWLALTAVTVWLALWAVPLPLSLFGVIAVLAFGLMVADSTRAPVCAACGEARIISAKQKLRDLEARPSARLRE